MSNGPFSPSTVFEPLHPNAHVYGSLTDLLSDGYEPTQVVIVHPDSDPPVTLRRTIADLRVRYEAWRLIDTAGTETFRHGELTVEWGWRLQNEPKWVSTGTEAHAREVVGTAPNLFELVARQVTAWAPVDD